jgi:hypothetical protein
MDGCWWPEVLTNGSMLLSGTFTNVNGAFRPGIARLKPDTSLDPAFPPGTGPVTPGGSAPVAISGLSATWNNWLQLEGSGNRIFRNQ